jgi:hypothetical protein
MPLGHPAAVAAARFAARPTNQPVASQRDGQNTWNTPPVLPDESSASRKNIYTSERQNL